MTDYEEVKKYIIDSKEQLNLLKTKLETIGSFNFARVIEGQIMSLSGIAIILSKATLGEVTK